jgi:hypothetical protein
MKMYNVQLLSFLFALSTFPKVEAVVSSGAVLSAGFTSDMVLAMAPAKSALYGLVFAAGSNLPTVTVMVDGGDPISAIVDLTSKGPSKSANACDKACFDQGYLSFGAISCCSQPSCAMGCLWAARTSDESSCNAQCVNASSKCSYTAPGTTLNVDMCEGCPPSGCPAKDECQAGCAAFFGSTSPFGWKAILPPMPAGGSHSIKVACTSGCLAAAEDPPLLERVAFGEVIYCSGQSNMALGLEYTYLFQNISQDIVQSNLYSNIKIYQFGGMSYQNDADAPVYATTAMNPPYLPWQNLTQAMSWGKGTGKGEIQALGNFPATCFYFAKSLTDTWGAAAPPIGLIANAVGGTTIASWSDPEDLAECTNATDTSSAAPPFVLFNGMASPFFNTTITAIVYYQGENDCGGTMGNSASGIGYGCALPKMISKYRARWSSTPGTTDPLVPFGIVTLAAGTSEGNGKNMAGMRFSQTCNYGVLPNSACPNTFLAHGYDISDPWESFDCDGQHCSLPDPKTGTYGPNCVSPWTNLSKWDPVMLPLAPMIRNDSTPNFMGGIHPRIKPPVGVRLAQAFLNGIRGDGTKAATGPTISSCSISSSTITVHYNVSLLRNEKVSISAFNNDMTTWGTDDSLTFMACFSNSEGNDCLTEHSQKLWVACNASVGPDGQSAIISIPSPPPAGGSLSALRYAWPLSDSGDTCCPDKKFTSGYAACIPGNCPVKLSESFLPGNPFYASITGGACTCLAPQQC